MQQVALSVNVIKLFSTDLSAFTKNLSMLPRGMSGRILIRSQAARWSATRSNFLRRTVNSAFRRKETIKECSFFKYHERTDVVRALFRFQERVVSRDSWKIQSFFIRHCRKHEIDLFKEIWVGRDIFLEKVAVSSRGILSKDKDRNCKQIYCLNQSFSNARPGLTNGCINKPLL